MRKFYTLIAATAFLLLFLSPRSMLGQGCGGLDFSADVTTGCSPLLVHFTATGALSGSTYSWDFGNGPVSSGSSDTIAKLFVNPGKYTVKLVVTSPTGTICTVTKTSLINVLSTPNPGFTVNPGRVICDGTAEVTFTDTTSNVTSREWIIDGTSYPNASATIKHTFSTPGVKGVSLKVTNTGGCSGIFSDNKYLTLYAPADMDFCADIHVSKTEVKASFKPNVNTGGRVVKSFSWSFPGATPSSYTGQFPIGIVFSDPKKSYDVTLTITTADGCTYSLTRNNFITPFISVPKDSVCMSQQPVKITNLVDKKDGRQSFNYKITDGFYDLQSGTVLYTDAKSYDFNYSFKYSNTGCETNVTVSNYLSVKGPKVSFESLDRQQCDPKKKVHLHNTTNTFGAPKVMYTWYIMDDKGIVPGGKIGPTAVRDTVFIPQTAGFYNVALVAKSTNGCRDSLTTLSYIVVSRPKADFFADQDTICVGKNVKLKDATTPKDPDPNGGSYQFTYILTNIDSPGLKYTIGGSKEPDVELDVPGRYNVMQIVANLGGCRDTAYKPAFITVNGVLASVKLNRNKGCVPLTVGAEAKIIKRFPPPNPFFDDLKYQWATDDKEDVDIYNGDQVNGILTFNASGKYTIYFNIFDGQNCQSQVKLEDAVYAGTGASFRMGPPKCIGDTVTCVNTSKPGLTNIKWSVEPAQLARIIPSDTVWEPKFIFFKDTCYRITMGSSRLVDNDVCVDTLHANFCTQLPTPDFTTPDSVMDCAPRIARFTAESETAKSFIWEFGDGIKLETESKNVAHVYEENNDTGYNVKLTGFDSLGCSSFVIKKHIVRIEGPQPYFDMDKHSACDSLTVHFTNRNSHVENPLILFDDGSQPGTFTRDTVHTYYMRPNTDSTFYIPGAYDQQGSCKAIHQDTVKLYHSPIAKFYVDSPGGCVPMRVQFHDTSYNAVSWKWDFNGDGIIDDSVRNPVFVYDSVGKYSVSLSVANRAGCINTLFRDSYITVSPIPEASFTASQHKLCQKGIITFTNQSKYFNNYSIDYGDGSPSDSNTAMKHQYYFDSSKTNADSIVFRPVLKVYNAFGCYQTDTDTVVVYARPVVGYIANGHVGCSPFTVTFIDTSLYRKRQEWDFNNDGITDTTGDTVSWTFQPGYYTIRLRVYNREDCLDSLIKVNNIYVQAPPVANFSVSDTDVCLGDTVQFMDKSTPVVRVRSWYWKFNDPNADYDTSVQKNPKFAYVTPGYHEVMLAVKDDKGCVDTIMKRSVFVEDQLPPQNSKILYVTVGDNDSVTVVWDENTIRDFGTYHLYRGTDPSPVYSANSSKNTQFIDLDPSLDTKVSSYCYSIQTIDKCGNISIPGDSSCTIVLTAEPDATPGANILKWSAYHGWPVKFYHVYRSSGNNPYQLIAHVPGDSLQYVDSMLCDENYMYYVRAEDWGGRWFSRSNKDSSRPAYIYQSFAPELYYATVDNDSKLRISWEQGIQHNLKQYHVDKFVPGMGWYYDYALTNNTSFTDNNVDVHRTPYTYKIRTEDDCGYMSPYSNIAKSMLLTTWVNDDKVYLRWNHYRQWAAGINQYQVQLRMRDQQFRTIAYLQGTDSMYVDDSVHADVDTAYCYRIMALENNINGDTSVSNVSCAVLPSRVYVPNAFSPNNDGTNDVWHVVALGIYNMVGSQEYDYQVQIFNRWGQRVFESSNVYDGWDGNYQGRPAPMGVYLYRIRAQGIDGRVIFLKGDITLLR